MPHYVMSSSLSESGRKVLRGRPGWNRKTDPELERKVCAKYAAPGLCDSGTVLEAADNETVGSISIEMGARGSVNMMTMPAISSTASSAGSRNAVTAGGRRRHGGRTRP